MCCEQGGDQRGFGHRGHTSGRCGCGCGPFLRRFVSAKEEREWLKEYEDQLKKELSAVEEHLKEPKSE